MKRRFPVFFIVCAAVCAIVCPVLGLVSKARAVINVFACEPEWAALVTELGGDNATVIAATSARQNPHYIRAKPSLIAAVRNADLIVCSGASLEVGWLPLLLQKAGNERTQVGGRGYLLASDYVTTIDKPSALDRADGDVHPEGNPHLHLNPHNIALMAGEVTARLKEIDPANSAAYQSRLETFSNKWTSAMLRWEAAGNGLRGARVVVHHKSFSYLIAWLGMREVGALEPKPGIPPSSSHLESLLLSFGTSPTIKSARAQMIIRTPFDSNDASEWLAGKTGIPAVELPFTVGGNEQSASLVSLFDSTLSLLTGAISSHAK